MLRGGVALLAVAALVVLVGGLALSLSDCEKKPDANAAPADVKRRILT